MFKKRATLFFLFLVLSVFVTAQTDTNNTTKKRTFSGSATINMGQFDDYFLRVVTGKPVIYVSPGETVKFKMYVRRGDSPEPIHDIQVIDNNDKFTLSVEPKTINTLRNIDMVVLNAKLSVLSDTPIGAYPLKIKVNGKEFVEAEYPMDTIIDVGDHNNFFGYLLLLISIGFIALLVWRHNNIK